MARPFQQCDNSDEQDKNSKKHTKDQLTNSCKKGREKSSQPSPECGAAENPASSQSTSAVTNIYCISNSKFLACGPTFINVVNNGGNNISGRSSNSSVIRSQSERQIKVKKGIFDSKRIISNEDTLVVAEIIKEDWKKLLKELPGVSLNGSQFQQTALSAMERKCISMTEAVLCTWKEELPEFSTIGNLSKTLFSIGYPDVVTYLNP